MQQSEYVVEILYSYIQSKYNKRKKVMKITMLIITCILLFRHISNVSFSKDSQMKNANNPNTLNVHAHLLEW